MRSIDRTRLRAALILLAGCAILLGMAVGSSAWYAHFIEIESRSHRVADLLVSPENPNGSGSQELLIAHLQAELGWFVSQTPFLGFITPRTLIVRGRHYLLGRVQRELEDLRDG